MGIVVPRLVVSLILTLMVMGPASVLIPSLFTLAPGVCPAGTEVAPEKRPTGSGYSVVIGCRDAAGAVEYGYTGRAFLHLFGVATMVTFGLLTVAGLPDPSRMSVRRSGLARKPARRIAWGDEKEARALIAEGKLIHAIKLLTEAGGLGLQEAKDYALWLRDTPERALRVPGVDGDGAERHVLPTHDGTPGRATGARGTAPRVKDSPEAAAVVLAHLRALRDRGDPLTRLANLQTLRDAGLVSPEEHERKRREILGLP